MPSTHVRRAAALFGGFLLGGGVSSYLEATTRNIYGGVLVAGLGLGLMFAALVRE